MQMTVYNHQYKTGEKKENDVFFLSQETFNQVYDVAVTCYLYYPGDNHDYDIKLKHMNGHNKYLYDQERN